MAGRRDQALITRLVARIRASVTGLGVLVCVDGLRSYVEAVTKTFRIKLPRHGQRGRCRQVLADGIRAVLQATGTGRDIHTAYIERLNATFRGRWAGLARKSRRLARTVALAEAGMWLVGTVYNFCTGAHLPWPPVLPQSAGRAWRCSPIGCRCRPGYRPNGRADRRAARTSQKWRLLHDHD